MPSFIYPNENIESMETLYQALVAHGVSDAVVTSNGSITITTDVGIEAQANSAILDATIGSLFANKAAKINEVSSKSQELLSLGVDDWSGHKVQLSKNDADNYYTDYQYFTSNPLKISAATPYAVFRLDGAASVTSDVNDIQTLSENAVDRIQYLYTAALNGDGSKGELTLTQEILASANQAELDAIIDTRS